MRSFEKSSGLDCEFVGLGYCGLDYLARVPFIPVDDKAEISQSLVQGGGPAATATFAAARLGIKSAFCGTIGDDERGRAIVSQLQSVGVDVDRLRIRQGAESAAAYCWIEEKTGKRSIAWTRGTAQPLSPSELDREAIRKAKILHLDGHQGEAAVCAAELARENSVVVSLDAGTFTPQMEQLLALSDIVIASEKFAARFAPGFSPEDAAKKLFHKRCKFAGITLGARGSVGFDGTNIIRQPAFAVDVVDTTGAGDVFHGAFAAAYLLGRDWRDSLRFAAAAAALKCTAFGGRTGIPDLAKAEEFLRKAKNND